MREIKFRGMQPNSKSWIYGYFFKQPDGSHAIFIPGNGSYAIIDGTVGQYTGLKDKHGKEIYDGDKIKSGSDIMTVIYHDKIASFALTKEGWTFCHYFGEAADPEHCEVIGNIYENTELLNS